MADAMNAVKPQANPKGVYFVEMDPKSGLQYIQMNTKAEEQKPSTQQTSWAKTALKATVAVAVTGAVLYGAYRVGYLSGVENTLEVVKEKFGTIIDQDATVLGSGFNSTAMLEEVYTETVNRDVMPNFGDIMPNFEGVIPSLNITRASEAFSGYVEQGQTAIETLQNNTKWVGETLDEGKTIVKGGLIATAATAVATSVGFCAKHTLGLARFVFGGRHP